MIEIRLAASDLSRIRFARSPMEELVHSIPVLAGTRRPAVHRPWVALARPRVEGLDLRVLTALAGGPRFLPDFLAPPPERLTGVFADELAAVAATGPEQVRRSLDELRDGRPELPEPLRPLYEDPAAGLAALAESLAAYWEAALAPVWPRIRALHDADLAHRSALLTAGGLDRVFADLHPQASFTGDRLLIDKPGHRAFRDASGSGLVLVPCVFAWPHLSVLHNEPYQPALGYAPRGIGTLWEGTAQADTEPLGDLLGRSRAALLAHLDLPASTTQLAAYLNMSAAAVSQHLGVLRRTRLVTSQRSGRWMLHRRTALASRLLSAADD
ncbi:helix-turn-helix domain-containing protein [Streptomyces bambusae]|uniref:ArsR/SmtB family transcription factor n=1 Tax=Streptomyces bambusae TaxID=1550616 RepID=UPI001CFCC445|nr:DUF5937 family protein [Streptomyces bambusae]MCB5166610.1 helix-turn-helix domain-containing protein [Streptomyces bambusae]